MLAPDLFCHAIDWLMSRVNSSGGIGIHVGNSKFDDPLLQRFDDEACNLGLHVSWAKTKIQNIGSGGALPALSVGTNTVESVNDFIYLAARYSAMGVARRR